MKIKRIFCGALAVGMLLGQTSSVLAEAVSSPTPTPNPHTEYYAQAADTDSTVLQHHMFACSLKAFYLAADRLFLFLKLIIFR